MGRVSAELGAKVYLDTNNDDSFKSITTANIKILSEINLV